MAGVRDKYLRGAHKDIYYISEEDEKKMLNECQRMRGNDQLELLKWCQNANNDLSGILFFSLITGIGYDYISKRYWIPIAEKTSKAIGGKSWMKCTGGYFGENMTMERWQKGYSE